MGIHLNIGRGELLSALASIQNVTGKKGTIAILSNVLIQTSTDSIILTATDLEVGMRINIPSEVLSSGSITLPSKKLLEIVRESNSENIHIEEAENNWVKIEAGSSMYNLAGMKAEEYPTFPEYSEEGLIEIKSETVKELIDKTLFSVAGEGESQFNLTGALLEKQEEEGKTTLRMVSSDGHRLSLMENVPENDLTNLKVDKTTLIPRKGLLEIRKLSELYENIELNIEDKQAVVKSDNTIVIVRLLNGDFPDYHNIVNIIDNDNFIEVDKNKMTTSMKRMNLFTEDRFNVVNLKIDKHNITLSSQSADLGNAKDEIPIKYGGEPFSLFFNGRYFIESMQVLTSEKVKLHISSERSPCFIKADDDPGFLSVIMPMKI